MVQRGFGGSQDKRETLNLGLQLHGAITPNWNVNTTISYFDVLKDIRAAAFFSQNDPGNTAQDNCRTSANSTGLITISN